MNTDHDLINENSVDSDLGALSAAVFTDSGNTNMIEEATEDGTYFRLIQNMTRTEAPPLLEMKGLQAAVESVKTHSADAGEFSFKNFGFQRQFIFLK